MMQCSFVIEAEELVEIVRKRLNKKYSGTDEISSRTFERKNQKLTYESNSGTHEASIDLVKLQ